MFTQGERSLEILRATLRAALYVFLIAVPLPFGSVQPWAVFALEMYVVALTLLASALVLHGQDQTNAMIRRIHIPVGLLIAIGVAQLIPVPDAWTRIIANPTANARMAVSAALPDLVQGPNPTSIEPPATLDALLRLVSYGLIALCASLAVRTRAQFRTMALVVALSGACQALYGSTEYLSGRQHIFWYAKRAFADEASGTFINRNHFAGYLILALALAYAVALDRNRHRRRRLDWRSHLVALTEPDGLVSLAGWFSAAVAWVGVVLSYSRGGMAVALIVTAIVFMTAVNRDRRVRFVVVVLILPITWLLWQEVRAPGERFLLNERQIATVGGRAVVWQSSLRMVPDYPILGTGYGTYEDAFALYRPSEVRLRWDHAHNDWLQVLVEGGAIAVAAVGVLLIQLIRLMIGRKRSILDVCVLAGIVGTALHATVDFGLRIPAIAATVAAIVGAYVGSATPTQRQKSVVSIVR